MKKLFLLLATGLVAFNGNAQEAAKSPVKLKSEVPAQKLNYRFDQPVTGATANKTTIGGSRWYSLIDQIASYQQYNGISSTITDRIYVFTIWGGGNVTRVTYTGGAPTLDTIEFCTYASILDPSAQRFNDWNIPYNAPEIGVTATDPYNVDSFRVYGVYRRNPARASVVDTLRFAFVRNANIPVYKIWGSGITSNWGIDTLRLGLIKYDSVLNRAVASNPTNEAAVVKDILLTTASVNDTTPSGDNVYGVALNNYVVNANSLVGASVTFISGDPSFVPFDTLVTYDINNSNPVYKYNVFLPGFGKEQGGSAGGAITLFPDMDNNSGGVQYNPPVQNGWNDVYYPSILPGGKFGLEIPWVEWKITCPTCLTTNQITSVGNLDRIATVVDAYPNPVTNQVTIGFSMKETADVTINIFSVTGELVKSQNLGRQQANHAGKAVFSTFDLANGVYIYTVEANGQRLAKRFVVAH